MWRNNRRRSTMISLSLSQLIFQLKLFSLALCTKCWWGFPVKVAACFIIPPFDSSLSLSICLCVWQVTLFSYFWWHILLSFGSRAWRHRSPANPVTKRPVRASCLNGLCVVPVIGVTEERAMLPVKKDQQPYYCFLSFQRAAVVPLSLLMADFHLFICARTVLSFSNGDWSSHSFKESNTTNR